MCLKDLGLIFLLAGRWKISTSSTLECLKYFKYLECLEPACCRQVATAAVFVALATHLGFARRDVVGLLFNQAGVVTLRSIASNIAAVATLST